MGHALLSESREFERGVTAAVNAAVQPLLERYIRRLVDELSGRGYGGEVLVMNDEVGDQPLVVWWKEGTISTFGNFGRDTGSTGVFSRQVGDQVLDFQAVEGGFEDEQTGSLWNILGEAVDGPLAGEKLEKVVAGEHFWFAWVVFRPDTIIRRATD